MSANFSTHHESCFTKTTSINMLTGLLVAHLLLLPLLILVLWVAYQRWRKHRSVSRAMRICHSDALTYNMVLLELISFSGFCLLFFGSRWRQYAMMRVGLFIFSMMSPGKSLFHLFTCLERYLAVVHPVTYLDLRQTAVIQIRNITIVCVWLVCFGIVTVMRTLISSLTVFANIFFLSFSAIAVSVSSLSVFCVLTRPGPGNRVKVDRIRQRALNNMLVLTGTLLLKFLSNLIGTVLTDLSLELDIDRCLAWMLAVWFGLPGSVVLPLLFLHRAGKLPGCRKKSR